MGPLANCTEHHDVENLLRSSQVAVLCRGCISGKEDKPATTGKTEPALPMTEATHCHHLLQAHTIRGPLGRAVDKEWMKCVNWIICLQGNEFLSWNCPLRRCTRTQKHHYILCMFQLGYPQTPSPSPSPRYCHQFTKVVIPHDCHTLNKCRDTVPGISHFRQKEQLWHRLKSCHTRLPFINIPFGHLGVRISFCLPQPLSGTSVLSRTRPEFFSVINLVIGTLCRCDSVCWPCELKANSFWLKVTGKYICQ